MADMQIVPAYKSAVEAQYVEMMVPLYSYGCERKVKKALSHLRGIYSVNVEFQEQKVTVWGICNKYHVLDAIKSKRKEARFWNPEDNTAFQETEMDQNSNPSHSHFHCKKTLMKARSLTFRAWKKVFARSISF